MSPTEYAARPRRRRQGVPSRAAGIVAILSLGLGMAACTTAPAAAPSSSSLGTTTPADPSSTDPAPITATSAPAPTSAATAITATGPATAGAPASSASRSVPAGNTPTGGASGYRLVPNPIPYPQRRKDEMAAYAQRHYGLSTSRLDPKAIVLHFTETDTAGPAYNTFAADTPNRGELPGTCAHFLVDQSGVVQQLVPTDVMCRHAIGLNHVAIGIEIVQATHGRTSAWACQQILARPAQIDAVVALVRDLQTRYGIASADVVGHAMANDHRLFVDRQGWRNDHTDWPTAQVLAVRARL